MYSGLCIPMSMFLPGNRTSSETKTYTCVNDCKLSFNKYF